MSYTEWRFIGAGLERACLGQVDNRGIICEKLSGQSVQLIVEIVSICVLKAAGAGPWRSINICFHGYTM